MEDVVSLRVPGPNPPTTTDAKKGNAKSLKPWSYNQSNYNSVAETMIDLRDGLCVSLFMEHGAHAKNQGISPVRWKY